MKSRINKTEYTFDKYTDGTMTWYKNDKYHREKDKPAIIWSNGDMDWYKNGIQHRDRDLPAIINENGTMIWLINGIFIKEYSKYEIKN